MEPDPPDRQEMDGGNGSRKDPTRTSSTEKSEHNLNKKQMDLWNTFYKCPLHESCHLPTGTVFDHTALLCKNRHIMNRTNFVHYFIIHVCLWPVKCDFLCYFLNQYLSGSGRHSEKNRLKKKQPYNYISGSVKPGGEHSWHGNVVST